MEREDGSMIHRTGLTIAFLSASLALAACGLDGGDQQPPARSAFQQFTLFSSAGPCPPGADCSGFIVLTSDGTLSYDKFGEVPEGTVHSTNVTQEDLDSAIPVLTDGGLVALLDLAGQICQPPTDVYERMTLLTEEGTTHSHETTWCSDQPLQDARQVLHSLADRYLP